jgi:hypothetical protein
MCSPGYHYGSVVLLTKIIDSIVGDIFILHKRDGQSFRGIFLRPFSIFVLILAIAFNRAHLRWKRRFGCLPHSSTLFSFSSFFEDKTLLESEKFNLEKLNVLPRSKSRLRSFQRPGSTKLFGYMFSNLATRQPSYLPYVSICGTRFIWWSEL